MGHKVNTHLKYYGRGIDEEALERAVKRFEGKKTEVNADGTKSQFISNLKLQCKL